MSNAIKRFRAVAGDPAVVISVHGAGEWAGEGRATREPELGVRRDACSKAIAGHCTRSTIWTRSRVTSASLRPTAGSRTFVS